MLQNISETKELDDEINELLNQSVHSDCKDFLSSLLSKEVNQVQLLWALELSSKLKVEEGKAELIFNGKIPSDILNKLKECKDASEVEKILTDSNVLNTQVLNEIASIWSEVVVLKDPHAPEPNQINLKNLNNMINMSNNEISKQHHREEVVPGFEL